MSFHLTQSAGRLYIRRSLMTTRTRTCVKVIGRAFTTDTFLEYLANNSESLWSDDKRRNWLKFHCVLTKRAHWIESLFGDARLNRMGDVIEAEKRIDGKKDETFYAFEYEPGLVLVATTATNADYETALERRISRVRGLGKMWVRPDLFESVWRGILERFGGEVYAFISRRSAYDSTPAEVRPNYGRRINYSGNDATETMKELLTTYGVLPESLRITIGDQLKLQVTHEGLFAAQYPSAVSLEILRFFVRSVKDRVLEEKNTSEMLNFSLETIHSHGGPRVATVDAGEIVLESRTLDRVLAETMVSNFENYSFLDASLHEGSFGLTATVLDLQKGSVFDISGSDDAIQLIPKYGSSFESFLGFYRSVVEWIDDKASLRLVGESKGDGLAGSATNRD